MLNATVDLTRRADFQTMTKYLTQKIASAGADPSTIYVEFSRTKPLINTGCGPAHTCGIAAEYTCDDAQAERLHVELSKIFSAGFVFTSNLGDDRQCTTIAMNERNCGEQLGLVRTRDAKILKQIERETASV